MWYKYLIITLLFYLFALLQNSFLTQFNLYGVVPNLVFILFFTVVFFSAQGGSGSGGDNIFYAVISGIFLDLFSYTYLGLSTILFIIIGLLIKRIQLSLKNTEDKYPFAYFLPLFIVFLLAYNFLLSLFLDPSKILTIFSLEIIFLIIYNLIIASIFFYIYKRFFMKKR